MATPIESITLMPATVDDSTCWECGRSLSPRQAARTRTGWQAIVCAHCESWVAALLGPIPAGDAQRRDTR